jgi:hypothetical protein
MHDNGRSLRGMVYHYQNIAIYMSRWPVRTELTTVRNLG